MITVRKFNLDTILSNTDCTQISLIVSIMSFIVLLVFLFFYLRSNQGLCNAFSCPVSLVSFSLEQFPSLFLSFNTVTFGKSPSRLFGTMYLKFDLSGCLLKIRFRLNILRSKQRWCDALRHMQGCSPAGLAQLSGLLVYCSPCDLSSSSQMNFL